MSEQLVNRQNPPIRSLFLQKYTSNEQDLMTVKVQAANQSFYKITAKDKEGHLPLL